MSEYVGQSEYAMLALRLGEYTDQLLRLEREQKQRDLEEFIQELRQVDKAIDEYRAEVRQVVAIVLRQVGYRKRKGQWRMPRKMTEQVSQKVTHEEVAELERLAQTAEKKSEKPADIESLKAYIQAHPNLFSGPSQLALNVIDKILDSGNMDAVARACVEMDVSALKRKLRRDEDSVIEKLLVNDIVLCWLRLQFMEYRYTNEFNGSISIAKADHLERRLSATHKRYLQAVESLARVRRLLARAGVQVNVAQQQVVLNG